MENLLITNKRNLPIKLNIEKEAKVIENYAKHYEKEKKRYS